MTASYDALHVALATGSISERERAVAALQQLGGHAAVELLQIALSDSSCDVRQAAANALRQLGHPPVDSAPKPQQRTPTGYVYVLVNSSMPGLLKIGSTTRTVQERIIELSTGTAIPSRFVCAYYHQVFSPVNPQDAEALIHEKLAAYRAVQNREFFELESTQAILTIQEWLNHD